MSKNTFFSSFGKRSVLFPMLGDSFDGKKKLLQFSSSTNQISKRIKAV